ncbi:Gfo/Idh/MocA family oxidoreductase [Candidatus Sulfurimonas marisnigri]|uniref:Gfo/Idh/MocA family oxidoreductase n=1 Tax=Candidatus Sulfurimonas marisnigri TaxID=2740405 RepID=A0A7S7LZE1_9BACT|nr:Gfo/Idh/MocA family oxidoreductase [Candidatus Sulfurimonas marisnigri]QOY54080.1 Gfo/Idh/MocA family oxidoreductase [Candidatus Sulfurimonas marisnigri]
MKVLIIGYGSIGRRHEEVLSSFHETESIDIVTKQSIDNKKTFNDVNQVNDLKLYDYFVIASETHKHYEQLKYLETNVTDKIIFCEKPLFEITKDLKIERNQVFVGYVLRFHPMLQKLKSFLQNEKVLSVNVNCGQYLPTWRQNIDYRNSYSAKKDEGGGVLLDLSHEIDYIQWLFGTMKEMKSYQLKISDLEIETDDLTTLIGKTDREVIVNLSIDYISKITYRKMLIHTLNDTYELDFIKNTLIQKDKIGLEQVYTFSNLERNYMFEQMHRSILSHKKSVCSYNEGLKVMNTISIIQEQNK